MLTWSENESLAAANFRIDGLQDSNRECSRLTGTWRKNDAIELQLELKISHIIPDCA
jgi:DUF1680 family protein